MHERFEELLEENRGILFKLGRAFAWDPEDRRDLIQDISAQLWRSFAGFDEKRAKFSTWMYRVGLNVAISQRRRKRVRVEPLAAEHLENFGAWRTAEADEEREAELWRLIDGLEPMERALVVLYLDDKAYAEIAEIVGLTETNVATKLSRIKNKLRAAAETTKGA